MMGDALHLMVDGLAARVLTKEQVSDFLTAMPTREYLDMTLILGPAVYKTQRGWAGACIIAESHISIHCQGREVHCDIFSCKPFEPELVIGYCRDRLVMERLKHRLVQRGWSNWNAASDS